MNRRTYAEAGVSLTAAEAVVERLRNAVESTGAKGFGAFAGLYPLDDERLLAASTDGVGTKLILLREAGRLRDGGRDLAAHCINDVLTTGAKPLFLLDYGLGRRKRDPGLGVGLAIHSPSLSRVAATKALACDADLEDVA